MEAEQARILIVDDDRELRELIAETLSEYGYYSQAAKNGAELFAALEREPFDLRLSPILCKPRRSRRIYLRQTEGYI